MFRWNYNGIQIKQYMYTYYSIKLKNLVIRSYQIEDYWIRKK